MFSKRKVYCVFGCVELGAYMHRFPHPERREELFKTWLSIVGEKLKEKDNLKIYKNKRICDYHFKPEHKMANSHRLIHTAIPSLHLSGVTQSYGVSVLIEHNYAVPRMWTDANKENNFPQSVCATDEVNEMTETEAKNEVKKGPVFESGECRCCGATKRCRLLNVQYEFQGQKEIYADMFVDCFGLLLSHLEGEERERMICATCVTRLREAVAFRSQVLRCEERLLLAMQAGHSDDTCDYEYKVKTEPTATAEAEREATDYECDMDVAADILIEDSDNITDSQELLKQEPRRIERPSDTQVHTERSHRQGGVAVKVARSNKAARDRVTSRKQMLASMRRTREKLTEALDTEKTTDIVILEGNRSHKCTKAFANTVTIVENSYVCPFQSIFNNFYCDYCRLKFIDLQQLKEHCLHHDPSTFKDAIMDSMRRFGRKKTQLDIQRIDCRLCPSQITDIETFKDHITKAHGKFLYPVENEFLQFKVTQNLECVECGQTFSLFQALKKHMAEHFGTYTCHVCGTHFFNESYLIAHQKNHDSSSKQQSYPCEECGRTFKLKYSRDMHVSSQHRKEAAFQCIKCDDTFFSSRQRFKHMMAAHGEVSTFHCTQCDRVYDNRRTLLDHMRRIHVTMLKHKCSVCERRFYLPSMLKDHMSTHTGEKNYKCDLCGKSYPRLKSLKVHLQSHAAVKKFKCMHCSASFGQNVSLKNHLKRQHQGMLLTLNS